jgi:unsaturated chondroitin disaccharide hydrolase
VIIAIKDKSVSFRKKICQGSETFTIRFWAFSICFILCSFPLSLQAQSLDELVQHSLEFAEQQLIRTVTELQDTTFYGDQRYPRSTMEDGRWQPKAAGHWASGFLPGCFWYMYDRTGDQNFLEWAESWTAGLEEQKTRTRDHEVGFIIFRSFGLGYRFTGRQDYKEVLLTAANSLATRYNSNTGCLIAFNSGKSLVDTMPMLELLFWAVKNGGDPALYDLCVSHALNTIENHIREDGSCFQNVWYNLSTGAVTGRDNRQGWADSTTWARGHAWGIYGFTMTYRETGDERFLETAKKMADYYIENVPEDFVPFWDYQAPNIPDEERDASAAAIAVSGFMELMKLVPDPNDKLKYQTAASNILTSLCSPAYLAEGTENRGILLHGVGNRMNSDPVRGEVDVSLIYTDHFFIEALMRNREFVTSVAMLEEVKTRQASFQLLQNYPNPFNPSTTISYSLSNVSTPVTLKVFDILGNEVKTLVREYQNPGEYSINFNASNLASGTYFYRLQSDNFIQTIRMTLAK